jgi:hypothetical protein
MAFWRLFFFPFVSGQYDRQRFLPAKDIAERSMARLEFWASN